VDGRRLMRSLRLSRSEGLPFISDPPAATGGSFFSLFSEAADRAAESQITSLEFRVGDFLS
jgi:hypothetical protein